MDWRKHVKADGSIDIHEWVEGWGVNLIAENVKPGYADIIILAPKLIELAQLAVASTDAIVSARAAALLRGE
jgi:hypothetical protein